MKKLLLDEKNILFLLFLKVFVIQWIDLSKYYSIFLDVVIICFFLYRKINMSSLCSFFLFIFYIAVECMIQIKLRIFLYNLRIVLSSILIILFIGVVGTKKKKMEKIFSDFFYLINGYMILNIPILLLEMNDHFFWSGRHSGEYINLFKPDLISGLFGYNGTPMLGLFSCFFFIYDLWYYRVKLSRKRMKLFFVYYFFMLAFYLFISVPNDNKSFYIFLVLSYGLYYLSVQSNFQKLKEKLKGFRKGVLLILIAIFLLFLLYTHFEPFQKKIDYSFRIITNALQGKFADGSSVRFSMIQYYFEKVENKLFGMGFSSARWKENEAFGFTNFGQSDMGAFLIIGGFGIVFSLLLILYSVLRSINKSILITLLELIFMIFSMIMTLPITSTSITISIMFLFLICSLRNQKNFN